MINLKYQKILKRVEKPSRYIGNEINAVNKDRKNVKLHFALAFPDLYEIASSHFGIQILYSILNQEDNIYAERVFSPGKDLESEIRRKGLPLFSLESKTPLIKFDIIGFSLLYELNYTNVLNILNLSEIPFRSKYRDNRHPFVIAGGPCTSNPEPVADFFDAMIIGDGEEIILKIAKSLIEWKKENLNKIELLKRWSKMDGIYIPAFFDNKRTFTISGYNKITRTIIEDLDTSSFPDKPIVPYGIPVHDRVKIEISRGCSRGCRFCQAGMIYRPVRERSPESLLKMIESSLENTGYDELSLLSLSTGDYSCLNLLLKNIMEKYESKFISVSLPSLRAGTLTDQIMKLIKKVRKTGFTIAPEAGSQRLRNVINKCITEKQIIDTVDNALNLGWKVIKLYFMIGLPTETEKDLKEIVNLIKNLKNGKRKNIKLNVSFSPFIPKPHTPFQWTAQISIKSAFEKLNFLKRKLNIPGIQIKWQNPEVSQIESLFSRGDRSLGYLLESGYKKGCLFDGWTDSFRYDLWKEAAREINIDIEKYNNRIKDFEEKLPWDHIDLKIDKKFLIDEYEKSISEIKTKDCRFLPCNQCGTCDQKKIKPITFVRQEKLNDIFKNVSNENTSIEQKAILSFVKINYSKFFGHLEMINIFLRAIRRAKISVKFSKGFHPMPKISFEDTLPIGMQSLDEKLFITLINNVYNPNEIARKINRQLPKGLEIKGCEFTDKKVINNQNFILTYSVESKISMFDKAHIDTFNKSTEIKYKKVNRKGNINLFNLVEIVRNIVFYDHRRIEIEIKILDGKVVRPAEIIKNIFNLTEIQKQDLEIIKISRKNLYDKAKNV